MLLTRICLFTSLLASTLSSVGQTSNWSEALEAKIKKALLSVYETDQFTFAQTKELVENEASSADLKSNLFEVHFEEGLKAYIYVSQAPSMKNVFDYLVIFNKDLSIEKAKILIYREQHGRQIGTARWLSQFKGLSTNDNPVLGKNIDGISGATISATSMTKAINNLLKSIASAKEQGLI